MRKLVFLILFLYSFISLGSANTCDFIWREEKSNWLVNASKNNTTKYQQVRKDNHFWIQSLFIGEPTKNTYSKLYIKNITLSAQFFIKNFLEQDLSHYETFERILLEEHKIAMLGNDPSQPYSGEGGINMEIDSIVRMAQNSLGGSSTSNRRQIKIELIELYQRYAGHLRTGDEMVLFLREYINPYSIKERTKIIFSLYDPLISIPGVPKAFQPTNEFAEYDWKHTYAKSENLIYYLKSMHQTLMQIKNCGSCSQRQVLKLIAQYYHTGINGHLFERVNQSLLMSQVNAMMLLMGLQGLPHLSRPPLSIRIDMAALIMSSEKFCDFFIAEVLDHSL